MRWMLAFCVLLMAAPLANAQGELVHNVFTVDTAMADWQSNHPDRVTRFTLGTSAGGLPLHGVVITAPEPSALSTGEKIRVYLDGGHHGNEYLGVHILMIWVDELLAKADAGDNGTLEFLRDNELHIVPILNPDGNLRDTRYNARGVDLNRNYQVGWDQSCFLVDPLCFKGEAPHSEPAVSANVAYVSDLSPDLWVSTHTGIETLFWPQGDPGTPGDWFVPHAPDIGMFETLEVGFEAATNGRIDAYGGPAPAVGSAEDYGYGVLGVPSFVYEVHNDQFRPAYDEPMATLLADQLAGLQYLVDHARHMGAWLEWRDGALHNDGWGPARNVSLSSGAVIPEILPGHSVPAEGLSTWSYPALLIESSRMRTHEMQDAESSVATPAVLGLAALAAAMLIRRRP